MIVDSDGSSPLLMSVRVSRLWLTLLYFVIPLAERCAIGQTAHSDLETRYLRRALFVDTTGYWTSPSRYLQAQEFTPKEHSRIKAGLLRLTRDPVRDSRVFDSVGKLYALGIGGSFFPPGDEEILAFDDWVARLLYGHTAWRQFRQQLFHEGSLRRLTLLAESQPILTQGEGVMLPTPGFSAAPITSAVAFSDAALFVLLAYAATNSNREVLSLACDLYHGRCGSPPDLPSLEMSRLISRFDMAALRANELVLALQESEIARFQLVPASFVERLLDVRDTWSELRFDVSYDDGRWSGWLRAYVGIETNRRRFAKTVSRLMCLDDTEKTLDVVLTSKELWSVYCESVGTWQLKDAAFVRPIAIVARDESTKSFGDTSRAISFKTLAKLGNFGIPQQVALAFARELRGNSDAATETAQVAYWLAQGGDPPARELAWTMLEDVAHGRAATQDDPGCVLRRRAGAREAVSLIGDLGRIRNAYRGRAIGLLADLLDTEDCKNATARNAAIIELARLDSERSLCTIKRFLRSSDPWERVAGARAVQQLAPGIRNALSKELRMAIWDGRGTWGFYARVNAIRAIASLDNMHSAFVGDLQLIHNEEGFGPVGIAARLALAKKEQIRDQKKSGAEQKGKTRTGDRAERGKDYCPQEGKIEPNAKDGDRSDSVEREKR